MPRETVLHKVRTALGRSGGQPPAEAPEVRLRVPEKDLQQRVAEFFAALEKLGGRGYCARSREEACACAAAVIGEKTAVASNAPLLTECGITKLPTVKSGFQDAASLREACSTADFGITGADYALADTGTLVLFSSREEARLISLLPPAHLAVVPAERLLTGLDELFRLVPSPAERSSAMVLITGPSRTADIEQILVRGVHGPGEIHVIVIEERETTR